MNYKKHKNITIRLELFLVTNDLLILEVCLVMQKRDQKKWLYKRVLQSSLKGRARAIMCSPNCFHFNHLYFHFQRIAVGLFQAYVIRKLQVSSTHIWAVTDMPAGNLAEPQSLLSLYHTVPATTWKYRVSDSNNSNSTRGDW